MLGWALAFLVIAIIAAVFGFGGIATASAGIAQILFFVFLTRGELIFPCFSEFARSLSSTSLVELLTNCAESYCCQSSPMSVERRTAAPPSASNWSKFSPSVLLLCHQMVSDHSAWGCSPYVFTPRPILNM